MPAVAANIARTVVHPSNLILPYQSKYFRQYGNQKYMQYGTGGEL
jgi:hypothetical protein